MEVFWRQYSHWSMFILGALCFVILGLINEVIPWRISIEVQALIGSGIITALEFITGCIVNLYLGLDIWNYSDMPLNLLGQICLPYSLIWIFISGIAIILDDCFKYIIFDEEKPYYYSIIFRKYFYL
jgi:uncharacterized membrane protein